MSAEMSRSYCEEESEQDKRRDSLSACCRVGVSFRHAVL